ncbi:MAG: Salicylate hydroxylase [Hyphomicrobiales bacterium]|nr:Salicylate hydroxylase [Hyphomicrobiales bacterium]
MSEPLHVVIAGAGVGGLAAALGLSRIGARVTVLERAPAFDEVGAGIQLSPNATRILQGWGVLDRLLPHALAPEALRVRRARDGSDLMRMPLGALAAARWGGPHLVLHRADLQRVLVDLCRHSPGVTIKTNVDVLGFAAIEGGVQVGAREDGAHVRFEGDVLVGADGLRSPVRERLGLGLGDRPIYSGRSAWRALVPGPLAPASALRLETNLWLGARAHLVHYPLRAGDLVNLVAIVEDSWRGEDQQDPWRSQAADPRILRNAFSGWTREARDLIGLAKDWRRWPLFDRYLAPRWSLDRVVLLGDAAHPVLPFLAQGAALAIEDASALARAFAAHGRDVAPAIKAYENERMPRAADVTMASRRQGSIYHFGQPLAFARDAVMRRLDIEGMMGRMDWLYGYSEGRGVRRRLLP